MRLSPNYHKSVLIGVLVISTIFWVIVAAYQIRGQFPHGEIAFDVLSRLRGLPLRGDARANSPGGRSIAKADRRYCPAKLHLWKRP